MALLRMFAVEDVKSESFQSPFVMPAVGAATRAFADLANDKQTTVGRHPEDFRLIEVGTFDTDTGVVAPVEKRSFGFASEYVSKSE